MRVNFCYVNAISLLAKLLHQNALVVYMFTFIVNFNSRSFQCHGIHSKTVEIHKFDTKTV
jgi:hypothetical protein